MASTTADAPARTQVVTTNPVYGLLDARGRRVDLGAPVREFFEDCLAAQRRPILRTDAGATLSPATVSWLRALAGFWTTRADAVRSREVQTGVVVEDPIELFETTAAAPEPPETDYQHATVMLEIVLEHRPEPGLILGGAVPAALSALEAEPVVGWGLHEPLVRAWNPAALTDHLRAEMPVTAPAHWSAPSAFGEIAAARTEDGVVERVRVGVAHPGSPWSAIERARRAVEEVARSRMSVMTIAASAVGAHPDLRARPEPAPPERPIAALVGPAVLGRWQLSAADLAQAHGGTLVGRAKLPGVLTVFDAADLDEARHRYLAFAASLQRSHAREDRR